MTPFQPRTYARHVAVIPAAKLCDSIAIVFLSIEVRIRQISADTSTAAPFCFDCQGTRMTQMTKDFIMRHDENYVE